MPRADAASASRSISSPRQRASATGSHCFHPGGAWERERSMSFGRRQEWDRATSRRCSLPSPSGARWLARKECHELALSPGFALLLLATGMLVGHEFLSSVRAYSELSAGGAAVAGGMDPLDGILVPTFGAYDIAATLLLPFVVIRLFSNERSTGAWTLLVQAPV